MGHRHGCKSDADGLTSFGSVPFCLSQPGNVALSGPSVDGFSLASHGQWVWFGGGGLRDRRRLTGCCRSVPGGECQGQPKPDVEFDRRRRSATPWNLTFIGGRVREGSCLAVNLANDCSRRERMGRTYPLRSYLATIRTSRSRRSLRGLESANMAQPIGFFLGANQRALSR